MRNVAFVLALMIILLVLPVFGESSIVLHPNPTDYSANNLSALIKALEHLETILGDYELSSRYWYADDQWGSVDFAVYTAGVLSELGYATQIVQSNEEADGLATWILVEVSLENQIAWVPVEPSPEPGHRQPVLGSIPSYTDGGNYLWFDEDYTSYDHVIDPPTNSAPVARIRFIPSKGVAGQQTTFMASTSSDPDLDDEIVRYRWNLGHEGTADGLTVRHIFEEPGSYLVSITATDSRGKSSTTSVTYEVEEPKESKSGSSGGCGCGK